MRPPLLLLQLHAYQLSLSADGDLAHLPSCVTRKQELSACRVNDTFTRVIEFSFTCTGYTELTHRVIELSGHSSSRDDRKSTVLNVVVCSRQVSRPLEMRDYDGKNRFDLFAIDTSCNIDVKVVSIALQ